MRLAGFVCWKLQHVGGVSVDARAYVRFEGWQVVFVFAGGEMGKGWMGPASGCPDLEMRSEVPVLYRRWR